MTKLHRVFAMAAVLLAVALGAATAQEGGAVTAANVAQRIESAKTAADHQALAAYFSSQAAAAAEKVKEHEGMLTALKQTRMASVMAPHCNALIKSSKEAQKDYQKLAQEEENLAKQAGK